MLAAIAIDTLADAADELIVADCSAACPAPRRVQFMVVPLSDGNVRETPVNTLNVALFENALLAAVLAEIVMAARLRVAVKDTRWT
ncbi:MAG: hypothetical protein DDT26_01707 [Dehalococcoidia bacterium]|nr:hypothetical protein [Chloroflexota bacterium]